MVQKADGMTYAPEGKPNPVVKPGEFRFAAMHLDHGHIYGMCNGLIEAGGELVAVHDPQPARAAAFQKKFPQAKTALSEAVILDDPTIQMVAAAAIPCDRGPLGCRETDQLVCDYSLNRDGDACLGSGDDEGQCAGDGKRVTKHAVIS